MIIQEDKSLKPIDYKFIRQFAVQFAYQQDVNQHAVFEKLAFDTFTKQSLVSSSQVPFLQVLLGKLFEHLQEIDKLIEKSVKNWKIQRIAKVELAIIRVGCTEILYRPQTDSVIIISEATALAQEFGSANSPAFVNGVLDAISKEIRAKNTAP